MQTSPFQVVKDFEAALSKYTGAPFVVTTTSNTMGLLLVLRWFKDNFSEGTVRVPRFTYVGVPASIKNAGFAVSFDDRGWEGEYQLLPLPIFDSARRLRRGMYRAGMMQVLSFHWNKILGIQQGGAILHDNKEADVYLRRMRFDGRTEGVSPKDDMIQEVGYHCYMAPETAAAGLVRLSFLPDDNPDLPKDQYPDLSLCPAFYEKT